MGSPMFVDELGDCGHVAESKRADRLGEMADVAPFRAVRYARPSAALVAPPYDVISPAERDELARDPHNVVHVTLNESEEEAGRLFRRWLDEGVLVRDEEPAVWALAQDYVGPDGIARTRHGVVASLRAEPYETRTVLPHERTHAGRRKAACVCCAPLALRSSRSFCCTTVAARCRHPVACPTSSSRAHASGGSPVTPVCPSSSPTASS